MNYFGMFKGYRKGFYLIIFSVICLFLSSDFTQGQSENKNTDDLPVVKDEADEWISLFDGKTLKGWEVVPYYGGGKPSVKGGLLVLPKAEKGLMTGVRWAGDSLPENNYIISYEARRVDGDDIFAGLTFPYGDTSVSLVIGGWRGLINGLSSIDGRDASENETTQFFSLYDNRWYSIALRVTTDSICALLGSEQIVGISTAGKNLHLRNDVLDTGLTFWSYLTTGEIRNIKIKHLQKNS